MAFIRIRGVLGKIYVPDNTGPKKHNCKDCFCCQWCSNDRCRSCLNRKQNKKTKSRKSPSSKTRKR